MKEQYRTKNSTGRMKGIKLVKGWSNTLDHVEKRYEKLYKVSSIPIMFDNLCRGVYDYEENPIWNKSYFCINNSSMTMIYCIMKTFSIQDIQIKH